MPLIAAIDAGLRGSGVAVFDGVLVWAGYVRNPERVVRGPRAWEAMAAAVRAAVPLSLDVLVVEQMQMDGRTGGGRVPDVFEVVGVVGKILAAFAGSAAEMAVLTPAEWKGATPKAVSHARLDRWLGDDEWANVEDAGALAHNVLDAICLGIAFLTKRSGGSRG